MEVQFEPVDTSRIQILAIMGSIVMLAGVIELVRRGKLREEYSFVWIISSLILLFFSIFRNAFNRIAHSLGVAYSPALLILVMLMAGMVILVHFSIINSKLVSENKKLAQELAIQGERLRSLEKNP
jgi:hypothetical protein